MIYKKNALFDSELSLKTFFVLLGPNHTHPEKSILSMFAPHFQGRVDLPKKISLGVRLKSTRPSHGWVCWSLYPPEARQIFLLAGLSGGWWCVVFWAYQRCSLTLLDEGFWGVFCTFSGVVFALRGCLGFSRVVSAIFLVFFSLLEGAPHRNGEFPLWVLCSCTTHVLAAESKPGFPTWRVL